MNNKFLVLSFIDQDFTTAKAIKKVIEMFIILI